MTHLPSLLAQKMHLLNVNTGSRLVTYVIEATADSGTVMLNGPAARLGEIGDSVVILACGQSSDKAARQMKARIILPDTQNVPLNRPSIRRYEQQRAL